MAADISTLIIHAYPNMIAYILLRILFWATLVCVGLNRHGCDFYVNGIQCMGVLHI